MEKQTNLKIIRDRINGSPTGTVFVAADFADVCDKTSVNAYFPRLVKEGLIRRVMRGVYDKPAYNDFLAEYVAPAPDAVANALARNFGWTVVPCGDTALNLLGLSAQVPAAWVYVSDGTYKEYTYAHTTIQFRKTANKEISKLSYKTALTVQALKALGKDRIDSAVISQLKSVLTAEEKQAMQREAKSVTSWIYETVKQVCGG